MTAHTPEARAGVWARLSALAATIDDAETRAQYLTTWRAAYDARYAARAADPVLPDGTLMPDMSNIERHRLVILAKVWLRDQIARGPADAQAWQRLGWLAGLRIGAGLLTEGEVLEALAPTDDAGAARVDYDAVRDAVLRGSAGCYDVRPELRMMRCALMPRTDLGNAERFFARHGHDFRFTLAVGWLGWDGRRWQILPQDKDTPPPSLTAAVFATVREIQNEARLVAATGPHDDGGMNELHRPPKDGEWLSEKLAKWGRTSESSGKIGCIANLAKRWMTVDINDFDRDPLAINCHNGTLRFVRGDDGRHRADVQPHARDDLLTKLAAVDYAPDAPAPLYDGLINWAQPDAAMRRYLHQWGGYNLTADMGEQIFQIWYGPLAANGKSTTINAWAGAAGDYADLTNVQTFLDQGVKRRGDQATPDLVRLPGVRLLRTGEPPQGSKIDESLINTITGGDPMLVRALMKGFFEFRPSFKVTMACNERPDIPKGTAGIWRRVKVVPWDQTLAPEARDRRMPEKLRGEYAGIFARLVAGLIDWLDHGFVEPADVTVASQEYQSDNDPLASFLALCVAPDPGGRVQSSALYELFKAWCTVAGEREWSNKGFSQALKRRGFTNKASNGIYWLGIRMIRAPADFVDERGVARDDLDLGGEAPPSRAPDPLGDDVGDDPFA